jgi:hypothetical protein
MSRPISTNFNIGCFAIPASIPSRSASLSGIAGIESQNY